MNKGFYKKFIFHCISQFYDFQNLSKLSSFVSMASHVTAPLWAKCEDETHALKSENLESSRTPENLGLDYRG